MKPPFLSLLLPTLALAADPLATTRPVPPTSFLDPTTHHRVLRLTPEPDSAALYFNENGYTPDGRRMIYTTPAGISLLDLSTHQTHPVVRGNVHAICVGRKTPTVFYTRPDADNALYATNLDTIETRKLATLPPRGRVSAINADETLAAGTYIEGDGKDYNQPTTAPSPDDAAARAQQGRVHLQPKNKGQMMEERLAAHLPMSLFTTDLRTGESKPILHSTDWLNHLLFSPADPTLLMYCHEGPWHKVDRIWTVRTDGSQNTLIHHRIMANEIAGHEFWSHDGQTIYYDLQVPKSQVFYLAAYDLKTHDRTWYHLERNEWSIHFNVSPDGSLFCGDGGDPGQVAHAPDGQYLYLFHPQILPFDPHFNANLIHPGLLHAERLVNMSKQNYRLEPNASFTPDGQMIVFTSNMFGDPYVFGVELK